jgi:hypothetical protein
VTIRNDEMEVHKYCRQGTRVNDGRSRQPKCKRSNEMTSNQVYPPEFLRTLQAGPGSIFHYAFGNAYYAPGRQLTIDVKRHGLSDGGKLQLRGKRG